MQLSCEIKKKNLLLQLSCVKFASMGIIRKTIAVTTVLQIFEDKNQAKSVVNLIALLKEKMNKTTVYRIIDRLEQDGIIEMKRGIGYLVSSTAKEKFLNSKKEAFLKEELPCVFKTMDLLKIDFDEINQLYKKRKESA